ncbi:MAG: hypothetical protein IPM50_11110 [Acidobacteriota bacterium]|nr:MAG: hypothetical protein IPM50_11110 [Acidobacteriota bacterium]
MLELDAKWSAMIAEAEQRAADTDRHLVAEYLRLKARNDAIRGEAASWLFASFIEAAAEAQRRISAITIERDDPHRFALGNSSMSGALLQIRLGVRCLSVEAGWVRTPSDGVMFGKAFAAARIRHFGFPKHGDTLHLLYRGDLPKWHIVREDEDPTEFTTGRLAEHIALLIDDA